MKRRNFLQQSATGLAAITLVSTTTQACTTPASESDLKTGTIVHSVYFWLKEGLSEAETQSFTGFFEELRKVPTVLSLHYGKPAATNPRDVVDHSFSYNLIVTFANIEDITVYETHQFHLDAIEKYKHLWTNVKVLDTILN